MKITITLFAVLFICVLNISVSNAELPTYDLEVRNMTLNSPDDNELTFDIFMTRTSECGFFYAKGRYEFTFNPLIANGGTLTYEFVDGYSDLPDCFYPENPRVEGNKLIMQYNSFFNFDNIFGISDAFPGTQICRMRLKTSAPVFSTLPLNLKWNNPGSGINPVTRIFAFSLFFMREITSPLTHSIDSTGLGGTLPVELSAFTSVINNNNVTLNWSTAGELNNSGFEIERRSENSDWTKAGFVTGNGTTNNPENYTYTDRSLITGKYKYRLKQIDFNGNFEYFGLNSDVTIGLPEKFSLSQNYPNPFNPSTSITYEIPNDANVNLTIFDMSGREVKELINEFKSAGYYKLEINGGDLTSGSYLYRLSSDGNNNSYSSVKKMILIK